MEKATKMLQRGLLSASLILGAKADVENRDR